MKKFLAILLSVVLLVPALAVAVMADGEEITLIPEDATFAIVDNGSYTFEDGVLVMHAVENWPCVNATYASPITVNADDYSLAYDFVAEGGVNINLFFNDDESWTFSNSTLGLSADQFEAGSGDLIPGTYTGKVALADLFTSTKNMTGNTGFEVACPNTLATYEADGTLTITGINVYSIGSDVDVTVNKLALVPNSTEGDEEEPAGPIYVEKVVSSYKDYTTSPLFRQNSDYEWDETADIAYPDDELAEEMTNGEVAVFQPEWADFWDVCAPVIGFHGDTPAIGDYAGYEEVGYHWINVDLGAACNLSKFVANIHNMDDSSSITSVTVYVSADGEGWNEAGSVETTGLGDKEVVIELDEAVSAQYVEFRFTGSAYWMFVSEVQAIELVERNIVNGVEVPVTATETAAANENGAVTVFEAGESDRVVTSDEANLRYSWFIITDAEGKVVKIGNNLVKASENKPGFITEVTVPAGGQLIAFYYNADNNANQALMDTYNDVLLVANNGAAIYNEFIDVESDYTVIADESVVSIECSAKPSDDNTDNEGGDNEGDDNKEPEVSLEDELKAALGEANADAKFDLEISAPETYKAGDEITVTVTVKNITAENGLHVVNFTLQYDNKKLELTNDLDEEEDNRLVCILDENLPSKWENFSKVNNDFDADNEEGTPVNALNDGYIFASALTDKDSASTAIKEDGAVVFTFTFTAKADAEGDIGIVIPNETVEGALNNEAGAERYAGNGAYAIIKAATEETGSSDSSDSSDTTTDPVVPGDASSMIVFAIIALVAIAGSAVVIKTRR